MLFFQDERRCTVGGITNLGAYFAPKTKQWNTLRRAQATDVAAIDALYAEIQRDLLDKITIRRTRSNLLNDPGYKEDLAAQGIAFPEIAPPRSLKYEMAGDLDTLFWDTMDALVNKVTYARYRAIEFMTGDYARPRAKQIADTLRAVYQTNMVKRLESSFEAFRKSIATFITITEDMLAMFAQDKVLVIPEMDVKSELEKGRTLDDIVAKALARYSEKYSSQDDLCYPASAFDPRFLSMLKKDLRILRELAGKWAMVKDDPKLALFLANLDKTFLAKDINAEGKLVVFSESVDTLEYLAAKLARPDALVVHASNASRLRTRIRANFDANAPSADRRDDIKILLCSDALAEGVNLHRANVIVNYDTPWNATRLMQRLGRVNRIGSTAAAVYNFLFYPSDQGNRAIGLYQNSLSKMQGFHSALGEDSQIYSVEELLRDFKLFDPDVKDNTDDTLALVRIVRELKSKRPDDYRRIKALPPKCRVMRYAPHGRPDCKPSGTIVNIRSSDRAGFYRVADGRVEEIDLLTAATLMKADEAERPAPPASIPSAHFDAVEKALAEWERAKGGAASAALPLAPAGRGIAQAAAAAQGFLRRARRLCEKSLLPEALKPLLDDLEIPLAAGTFAHLELELRNLANEYPEASPNLAGLETKLRALHARYCARLAAAARRSESAPTIVLSETFVS